MNGVELIIIFPVAIILGAYRVYGSGKQVYRENKSKFQNLTFIINQDGVESIGEVSSTKLKWSNFKCFLNSKDIIFLFISEKNAQLFPKEVLNENEIEQLLELFHKNNILEMKK